jgi:Protein of unknown function (DUF3558)
MRTLALVVLAVVLAGCTGTPEPPKTTTEAPPVSSAAQVPTLGTFPPIPRTLNMDKYTANPCTLLDKADFDALGFAGQFVVVPGRQPNEPSCEVGGGSDGGTLQVRLRTDSLPLQQPYEDRSGKYEFIHAVDLVGLPTVVRAVSARFPGDCEVIVATGKQQGLTLDHQPATRKGGTIGICGRLATVAETLLEKLGA